MKSFDLVGFICSAGDYNKQVGFYLQRQFSEIHLRGPVDPENAKQMIHGNNIAISTV